MFLDKSKIDNLTKQDVYDVLSAAAKEFFFLETFYCQVDGITMVLCNYEKEWLDSGPIEFKFKLCKRYIDDIFVMFRFRDHVKKFVDYMNTKHPNIHFIFEIEDQYSFSFLDKKLSEILRKKLLKHQFIEKVHSVVFLLI